MFFYLFGNIGSKITFMALLGFMGRIALPVMSNGALFLRLGLQVQIDEQKD